MRLLSCYVEGYGCLRKKEYQFSRGLTEILGANGEGKTTLASFLKAMLYGLKSYRKGSTEFCDREHFYPFDGGKFGGNLAFEWRGNRYKIERFFGARSETDDTLTVYENGVPTDRFGADVGQAVLGVDRQSFERTLFFHSGDVEIGSTSCINAAFVGVTGIGDAQGVTAAVEALERAAKLYKKSRLGRDKITEQTEKITRLNEAIDNARAIRFALDDKYARYEALKGEIDTLTAQEAAARQGSLWAEQWAHYQELDRRIGRAEGAKAAIERRYPNGLPTYQEVLTAQEAMREAERLQQLLTGGERQSQKQSAVAGLAAGGAALVAGICCALWLQTALGLVLCALGAAVMAVSATAYAIERKARAQTEKTRAEWSRQREAAAALVAAFQSRYGVLPTQEVLDDVKELVRLTDELTELKTQAEEYRQTRGLDGKTPMQATGGEELSSTLSTLRFQAARLLREIEADEASCEHLDEYESEKRAAQELLEEYKRRHKLLTAASEFLCAAEKRLNERYVQPILDDFLRYADLLERVLGERMTMTREFELRFERGGEERSERHFSAGQRAICAFCFRLAMVNNLYRSRGAEQPFFILDDPFTALDETHMQRVKTLIKEVCKDVQVVYWTCHPSRQIGD